MKFYISEPHDISLAEDKIANMEPGWKLRHDLIKPDDYVWDENMTVKANREYTQQYNKTIIDEAEKLDKDIELANKELMSQIRRFILDNYFVNEKQADVVWAWCVKMFNDDAHKYLCDVFELIGEFDKYASCEE